MDDLTIYTDALTHVGEHFRPIMCDMAKGFFPSVDKMIVGVCMPAKNDPTTKILFAEKIPTPDYVDNGILGSQKYTLSTADTFVQCVLDVNDHKLSDSICNADEDNVLAPLFQHFTGSNLSSCEKTKRQEVDGLITNIKIRSIKIGNHDNAPILYALYDTSTFDDESEKEIFEEKMTALSMTNVLLVNSLRQAVFFATAGSYDEKVQELQAWFNAILGDDLPTVKAQQQLLLNSILHPVISSEFSSTSKEFPLLEGLDADHPDEPMFHAISIAKKIKVGQKLGGSLRGSVVYSAEIFPRLEKGNDGPPFKAVIKAEDCIVAKQSHRGLMRLWGYHNDLKKYLPQSSQFFAYEDGGHIKFSTVAPHVEATGSLFSFVEKKWQDEKNRQENFGACFDHAKKFISSAGRSSTKHRVKAHMHLYDPNTGVLGNAGDAGRRHTGLKAISWPSALENGTPILTVFCQHGKFKEFKMVNPYFLISHKNTQGTIVWLTTPEDDFITSFIHGDFHAENILVNDDMAPPNIVVLDFDYVGEGNSAYLDSTYLEASVLMAITASFEGNSERWSRLIVPSLTRLLDEDLVGKYLDSRTVIDMETIFSKTIKRKLRVDNKCVRACLTVSLLRMIKAYSNKPLESDEIAKRDLMLWSAAIYCGLALNTIISPENKKDTRVEINDLLSTSWFPK